MRISALHALVRDVRVRLSADRWRPRLHAAAGPAGHRRRGAAVLAGPFHRREHGAGQRRGFRLGRGGFRQRHACAAAADRGHPAPRPCLRPGRGAGRLFGVGMSGALSGIRLSARRRNGRRHRRIVRAAHGRCHAAAAPGRAHHERAPRADRISDTGLRTGADRPLSARQHPVLQRLPVPVRVLRHPRALRPRRAIQDGRAGLRRARQARGLRPVHARSISSTTISSPTSAPCARCCRT